MGGNQALLEKFLSMDVPEDLCTALAGAGLFSQSSEVPSFTFAIGKKAILTSTKAPPTPPG
jgi:hypothetical protein